MTVSKIDPTGLSTGAPSWDTSGNVTVSGSQIINGSTGIGITTPIAELHVLSGSGLASNIEETASQSFTMRGKIIQSYNNASPTILFSASPSFNCGLMIKVDIKGTSAVNSQMWEDVIYAWWYGLGGVPKAWGVGTATQNNVAGSHTSGTLSWVNPNTYNPALYYQQGNNGYILESLDVSVVARDSAAISFNTGYISFG